MNVRLTMINIIASPAIISLIIVLFPFYSYDVYDTSE